MSDPNIAPISYAVLKVLVEELVSNPDAIEIEAYEDQESDSVFMDVMVDEVDRGRVIGRRGRTADIIRTVVHAVSIKDDRIVEVDFLDD